ncbi:erythrocyte membrane protein 1 [Plasmodium falciparum RAJ116]|uniref:Erythrocyte membrane protein 1 n=1 Tax=Plasmodium falciparum RAJ116 TaxID=580058 RepID=A0A0L0CRN8_PLAFA|nr:erythrocyte membrane protein 1 [Plasmodium falciparum RAJ116]
MAPGSTGTQDEDAKNMFDRIGGIIQQQVHDAALEYNSQLLGHLSEAKFLHGTSWEQANQNVCSLKHTHDTNVRWGESYPCAKRSEKRFSDEGGGECDDSKIKGNKGSNGGACAPLRRLHLCVRNLEKMDANNYDSGKATHTLLAEVCMAAKYEGQSITGEYPKYQAKYGDSPSQICTMLARSFADIGDIIRGRDLYSGNSKEKNRRKKLEENLKKIFGKIYDKLDGKNGKKEEAKDHYEDKDGNYFKLREDWWDANRHTVWKAITCGVTDGDKYFRDTCSKGGSYKNCRCINGDVLTNFDYVPQFLRWFEEWAEEFCRIKKIKLKLAKNACRNESKQLYCSHNGYDCTKRIEKGDSCSRTEKCTECSTKCIPYEYWLEKQQNEFNMQKDKYENEIKTYVNNNGIPNSNINNEYYEIFYKQLIEKKYENYNDFLKLLNIGKYCIGLKGEEDIDFTNIGEKGTFYRSDYCQPCPDCVVDCTGGNCKENKKHDNCRSKIIEEILRSEETTDIDVLYSGKGPGAITKKLHDFCSNPNNYKRANVQKWKCYNKNKDYNNCEMNISSYKDATDPNVMLSVQCFYSWAQNLLIDIIRWEHQLKDCINNTNVTDCDNECNKNCECFEKWIKQKQKEWQQVKEVLKKKDENSHNYYNKLRSVFDSFLYQVMFALNNEEKGKWDQFTEDLEKKFESSKKSAGTGNSQDAIEFLLDHLNDNAITCKDNNSKESCENSKGSKPNPCIKNPSASNNLVSVKHIAEIMQQDAREQLEKRGGESKLKGDATKGEYKRGGQKKNLNGHICNIDKNYTNDTRSYGGPCHGKDGNQGGDRMKIGTPWKGGRDVKTSYEDVYLPPRREHMCTSNLEKLHVESVIKNGDASHSLLGDVLLAAKMDAAEIINRYKSQNSIGDPIDKKHQESICRALRYSFADLGDIIKGTDMWEHSDQTKLQGHLKKIFGKIKQEPPQNIKDKYNGDDNNTPPYKKLREDWWEANRHQVWRAMKCTTKNINNNKCNGIPIEDYIPQRLRWMVEWAEWFCKEQSRLYEELVEACGSCKGKVQGCTKDSSDGECTKCTQACNTYKAKIKKWEDQWKEIKEKYDDLYKKSLENGDTVTSGSPKVTIISKEDERVVEFLKNLHDGNKDMSNIYSSAEAYVHETADVSDCNTQNVFCNTTGKENYAFQEIPKVYEQACDCKKWTKKTDACTIATNLVKDNDGEKKINGCGSKTNEPYPGWDCTKIKVNNNTAAACIPPRRQKFCTTDLTQEGSLTKEEHILTKFVNCAAKETHFAWHKYKKDNDKAESELNSGIIPEGFKRQMYYTFGDYRDIFFGTDISTYNYISGVSPKVITILQKENGTKSRGIQKLDNVLLDDWWDEHGKEIWEGMLCALTHGVTNSEKKTKIKTDYSYKELNKSQNGNASLEDFASKPQFLRWFTEWAEDFCNHQGEEIKKLENKCNFSTCEDEKDNQKKIQCHQACWNYKAFLKKWKKQYKKQNIEYEGLRDSINISQHMDAPKYLEENCKDKCSCIKEADYTHYNKSFEYPPEKFQEKCLCELSYPNEMQYSKKKKSEPEQKKEDPYKNLGKCPFENRSNSRDSTTTVINNESCKNLNDQSSCIQNKYENNLDQWNGQLVRDSSKDNEGVLMPPRRVHLCTRTITKNKYRTTETDKFKKDLFDSAYNQGFLLGIKFKDYNDEGHEALKNSFYDYGDIIEGEDMMETTKYTNIKEKLGKLLGGARNQGQPNTKAEQPKNVNEWWTTNKTKVWHAMLCGYHQGINGSQTLGGRRGTQAQRMTAPTSSPTTTNIPHNWCDLPNDGSTEQFLRWLKEWGTQYCKEKEQLKSDIQVQCKSHLDKYGIIENRNDVHPNCLPSLDKYEVWSNNRLPEFDRLSKKFTKDKEKDKYNNVQENSAASYLKQNCSECKCSFKDIEQTHKKSKNGGYDIFVDILDKAKIPSYLEDTAYRYKGLHPECPNTNECNKYGNIRCRGLPHDDDNDWKLSFVNDTKTTYKAVLVPPRRRQLCLRIELNKLRQLKKNEENFKHFICSSALAETKRLKQVYKDDNNKLLQAIKYSFADIGNVVKGDDMMESPTSRYIGELFNSTKYNAIDRKNWWNENKYHVWESMLCAYRQAKEDKENNEICRFPDTDNIPQFLRWFMEWGEIFCTRRNELYKNMVTLCENALCNKNTGKVSVPYCIEACQKYKNYVLRKKTEYKIQKDKYDNQFKKVLNNKDAEEFLNVHCLSEYFSEKDKWENPYDTFDDDKHKDKCDCKKMIPTTPEVKPKKPALPKEKKPEVPPAPPVEPPPADQPFDPTILQTTIPLGIALALGSIAFLFLKKKTKSSVGNLFQILQIPKSDYDIPTLKSSNRYIPYVSDRYKGKTYIYIEGDSDEDKYAFMSDTTDVTSSESEYEELDINDIYVPGSPKYKTLIEVVLEPSGKNTTASDIPSDTQSDDIPNDGIPSSKITDNEWNTLKDEFISQYLQSEQPKDVPNDYKSGDIPFNTQPNTLYFDNNQEKPFITSIHDRNLYTGEEYNYDMSTNSGNNNLYSGENNVYGGIDPTSDNRGLTSGKHDSYSGIDLINDSLSGEPINIYDELLKRKENELFGTNNPKRTSTYSVAKNTNSDPIHKQLDLFHTWLDRHRDMCEKLKNDNERLAKLKEKWENETHSGNTHPSDSNKTLNTDVSIQIHMDNPKPINQFTNMDTILEDLDKYNEPYYDVQDDIYYDVNDDNDISTVNPNNMDVPSKVQIEMDVNTKLVKVKYPIADVWDI